VCARFEGFRTLQYTQITIIRWRHFTVGRLTQTPVKYAFSESLRIVDYEGIFIKIKKVKVSEYSALFPKVRRYTNHLGL